MSENFFLGYQLIVHHTSLTLISHYSLFIAHCLVTFSGKFSIMNYDEFREAGHHLVDYITDYLQNVSKKPLFNPVEPSFLHDLFDEKIPYDPQSLAAIQKLI